jgi:hypothetical protein
MESYGFNPKEEGVVFIHCREPKEIARICKEMNAESLLITRDEVETEKQSNHADADIYNYNYDYTICNDDTLEEFEQAAIRFLTAIGIKNLK